MAEVWSLVGWGGREGVETVGWGGGQGSEGSRVLGGGYWGIWCSGGDSGGDMFVR